VFQERLEGFVAGERDKENLCGGYWWWEGENLELLV